MNSPLRPDSTTAKFFARNCLCEIRMVGHEWFYWILSLLSLSQWVELNSTHWRSEFVAREERIQCNYSCATIRISHKQFLAKYFAVVESGLKGRFPLGEIFRAQRNFSLFFPISSAWELTNKKKFRCARKIPSSGKQPLYGEAVWAVKLIIHLRLIWISKGLHFYSPSTRLGRES